MKFKNFFAHPKTTVIGILMAITIAAPILEKVDWSHMTPASMFGLLGALATAFLGGLMKDPGGGTPPPPAANS